MRRAKIKACRAEERARRAEDITTLLELIMSSANVRPIFAKSYRPADLYYYCVAV